MNERRDVLDVLVIGGGMAGATLAALLAGGGRTGIALAADQPPPAYPAEPASLRVSALSPGSRRILEHAGVWEDIEREGISPYRRMQVWDARSPGRIAFDAAELGEPWLGYIVRNDLVVSALHRGLAVAGVSRRTARIEALSTDGGVVRARFDDGSEVAARLVAGADGAHSAVRTLAGIEVQAHGYGQRAIVACVETALPHEQTARQRFLPTGPLAFLPLADGRCSIVWSCDEPLAEELLALDEESFSARLGEAFEQRLGEVRVAGPRAAFTLERIEAKHYIGERVALLGDAAHQVHPLAGQGANLALMDAAALAELVSDALATGHDPGARMLLRRYERWRRSEDLPMAASLDLMKRLFGARPSPARALLGSALSAVDVAAPLKHRLVRQAMGLAGHLPAAARAAASVTGGASEVADISGDRVPGAHEPTARGKHHEG